MSKIYRYIVAGVITTVVLFLVWYFSRIVAYILIAAVLAMIGKPMTDLLCGLHIGKARLRIPKFLAALCTLITIWIVIIGVFALFVPILFQKINEFSSLDIPFIIDSFREPLLSIEHFLKKTFSIQDDNFSIINAITDQLRPLLNVNLINDLLASIVNTVSNTVVAAFSISFITFFFLKESSLFYDMVLIMFPKKYEANISRALNSTTSLLIRYFTGIVLESSSMTFIVSIGLLIWGFSLHNALVIGLIVGVLNVIPYLGPTIGIGIGLLIGVTGLSVDLSVGGMALRIAGTILFAQGVDNFLLQPLLYSHHVKAHPLEIFLVILIAGSIAGILGMLLAIPAYNVIRVFAKEFFNNFRVVQKLTEKI
ncbi:MAG: AI-2E family transporter [Alistipes sp.]|nr:AI-2E family transporter [Alistipes sp.]